LVFFLITFSSRAAVLLGVLLVLVVGAAFGLPFINSQSLQAQSENGVLEGLSPAGAPAQDWATGVVGISPRTGPVARPAYGPPLHTPAEIFFDLDPRAEQWTLRRELLAHSSNSARRERAAFRTFVAGVATGDPQAITGVYVPGGFAYPVDQQPAGNAAYVSDVGDRLTQFNLASQYGTIGFLAHNDLAGASFFKLSLGQKVQVVFGDGSTRSYLIVETHSFQAEQPYSPYSDFLDLKQESMVWSAEDLFFEMYAGDERVVFQTCIAADGVSTWGRYFVIAIPTP
jgi:hypothetical protein